MSAEKVKDDVLELDDIKLVNDMDSTWGVNYVLVEIKGKEKILSRKVYENIIKQLKNKKND
tara:strand:- start:15059 stop:15241 length:183 start_codon:yes stop_codon:yes gene_type:complete